MLASKDLDELINKVAEIPLLSQPGEQWYYSVAVDLQGYIVQKLSGMKYGEFLEKHIFKPLKMADTGFFVKKEDQPRFAEIHSWDSERNRLTQRPHRKDRPSYLDPNRLESGGGGLVSTAHDYARFLQMLVNEGSLEGAKILTPESVRIMRTNSLRDELDIRGGLIALDRLVSGLVLILRLSMIQYLLIHRRVQVPTTGQVLPARGFG